MKRYENTTARRQPYSENEHDGKRNGGFRKYQTTIYDTVPEDNTDVYVITQEGDRLDNLAFEFYGDPRFWVILAIANHLGKGSTTVDGGIQLRIPPKSVITNLRLSLEQVQKDR